MAVSIDVTWGRPDTKDATCFATTGPYGLALALYSLLCRHIDPFFPDGSDYDWVRRPGIGFTVALGRRLGDIATGLAASQPDDWHASLVLLDERAWPDRDEVGAALHRMAQAAPASGRHRVVPIMLFGSWAEVVGDLEPMDLSSTTERHLVRHLRAHVLVHVGLWLSSASSGASLSLIVRRSPGPAGAEVFHALQESVCTLRIDARCSVADSDPTAAPLATVVASPDRTLVFAVDDDGDADTTWQDRDALDARQRGLPVLTLRPPGAQADLSNAAAALAWRAGRAEEIVEQGLDAWVRRLHFQVAAPGWLALARVRKPYVILARSPVLADFALGVLPTGRDTVIVHPDPPLTVTQTKLLARQEPQVRLITPTTMFASARQHDDPAPPLTGRQIAMSMAVGPHAPRTLEGVSAEGFNELQQRDAVAHLTVALVRAGARLAYSGRLDRRGMTAFLAEMIARHNLLGTRTAVRPVLYGHTERPDGLDVELVACPAEVDAGDGAADAAVACSTRRLRMAADCAGSIALGGRERGYVGRFPGVLEECWHMLHATPPKPVYVLGGFGGAARRVGQALLRDDLGAWIDQEARHLETHERRRVTDYERRWFEGPCRMAGPRSLRELVDDLARCGEGLRGRGDTVWTNGLTAHENRQLFAARDPHEIAALVMRGLTAVVPMMPRVGDGPAVRVFCGNIADLERADAYAVPVVADQPAGGACATLDRRLGGAISRALSSETSSEVVEVTVPREWAKLPGRRVFVVRLAAAAEVVANPRATVEAAMSPLREEILKRRVSQLAVVPFAATLGLNVATSFELMRAGLANAGLETITFCEPHVERYARLEAAARQASAEGAVVVLAPQEPGPADLAYGAAPIELSIEQVQGQIMMRVQAPIDAVEPTVRALPPVALTPELEVMLERLCRGSDSGPPADLERAGDQLAALFPGIGDELRAYPGRGLDLVVDDPTSAIPWEALRYPDSTDVPLEPALAGGVRRRLVVNSTRGQSARRIGPGQPLAVLLVLDPTENLPAATDEGKVIRAALARHVPSIETAVCVGREATIDGVLGRLQDRAWDVLHYAGHTAYVPGDADNSGLKLWHGRLTAEHAKRVQRWPPLVVVNSCRSAAVASFAARAPLGTSVELSWVRNILCAGVRSYIGTLWPTAQAVCSAFTSTFYDKLVLGETVGEAVRAARLRLGRDHAGYVTYGDVDLRF